MWGIQKKILIIDNDKFSRNKLRGYLEKDFYKVEEALDGEMGIQLLVEKNYDLTIVELNLPGINGVDVCNIERRVKKTPIIIMISSGEEKNILSSLRHDIDDYILKPFSKSEISHRVNTVFQRVPANNFNIKDKEASKLAMSNAIIDWDTHRISVGDQEIYLTPKEYELLFYMSKRPNKIHSRDALLKAVWNDEQNLSIRAVDTAINRLRDKINKVSPEAASTIKTIWRVGYLLKLKE